MRNVSWQISAAIVVALVAGGQTVGSREGATREAQGKATRLQLEAVEREPTERGHLAETADLAGLRRLVESEPRVRAHRFALVRALQAQGRIEEALTEARAWREHDAYNLVVVRLIGDLYAELGQPVRARRAYSAVTELLPDDAAAQRALATVLKQGGDLAGARDRLAACTRLSPNDPRLWFEWADVVQRLGQDDRAAERLQALTQDPRAPEELRYPARQRLAQIWGAERRGALARGQTARADELGQRVARLGLTGGSENDIKIFLTWDTDRTDVDLWVTTPSGEKVFYGHKSGANGEALYHDVTTGYGPESFTVKRAAPGTYLVQVHYYAARGGAFSETGGEVQAILDEGRSTEAHRLLPYRMFEKGQTVTVALIHVS